MKDDHWQADFYRSNDLFTDITELARDFEAHQNWPDLVAYNQLLQKHHPGLTSLSGKDLYFVAQEERQESVSDHYEVRIYQDGEIQTRERNWHDFFQVLMWCQFPLTKRKINQLHAEAVLGRLSKPPTSSIRSPVENCLTLFDECGMIIAASERRLLDLINQFKWRELFINHRSSFEKQIDCYMFGHAMYEKSLQPYIGMTANSLCLLVDEDFFDQNRTARIRKVDQLACDYFSAQPCLCTSDLHPLPLLGIPGWDARNKQPEFYDNSEYFRKARNKRNQNIPVKRQQ